MRLNTQSQGKGASKSGSFRPGIPTTGAETPPRRAHTPLPADMLMKHAKSENVNPGKVGGEALDCGDSSPLSPAGLVPRGIAVDAPRRPIREANDGDKSPSPKRGQVPRSPRAAAFAILMTVAAGGFLSWLASTAVPQEESGAAAPESGKKLLKASSEKISDTDTPDGNPAKTPLPPLPQTGQHRRPQFLQPASVDPASPAATPAATKSAPVTAAQTFESNRQRFLKNTARLAASQRSSHAPFRQIIDPGSPGAILTTGGQHITVEATRQVPGFASPALEIAVTTSGTPANSQSAGIGPINPIGPIQQPTEAASASESPDASQTRSGFTREEELFRTRWGWAAYDDVQRAAFETAHQSE